MSNRYVYVLSKSITALVLFFQCVSHLRLIIGVQFEYYAEVAGKNF